MKWKLFLSIFLLGSMGSYCMAYIGLPITLQGKTLPIALEQLQLASLIQSLLFVAITSTLGVTLHQNVQLDSPILKALITTKMKHVSFKPILQWGVMGGICGGVILVIYQYLFQQIVPISATNENVILPISVRIFYGGITEEILMRWGLMTLFVWLLLKLSIKNFHHIPSSVYWLAIVISALFFAVLHLPMLFSLIEIPSATLISMVIIGNSLFGLIAGYLYWKQGLESAMIAHILAHVFAFLMIG